MPDTTLDELLARVALGDRAAFRKLYGQSSAQLFGCCLRILKERRDAEDALQEIYIRIWHRAGSFRAEAGTALGWMLAIARNHAIDRLRQRRPGLLPEGMEAAEILADEAPNPEESVLASSEGQRIAACLQELDANRAEAVRRAYVEGESYLELAERFAVPLNTMRSWLRRSLIVLRECLSR